ncbi:MAG: hypothetical protein OJF55_001822 [Rhodanobacteraceae bacterium]|jgi:TonB family protein|nr:MAG: hypothetical protein OJF55_001822 [Rhodanobacteraceae bacterium]
MKRSLCVLLALALCGAVCAAEAPIEASMVITGTITVNPAGGVQGYALHDQDKIPPGVVQIVERTIKGWQFVPIVENGQPVAAQAGMAVRVVARMIDKANAEIRVAGASFGCDAYQAKNLLPNACPPGTTVTPDRRQPPEYPRQALKEGLGGEVYLAVEVGRDGRVIRADAMQVNLSNRFGSPLRMQNAFANNARDAAMKWRFNVPTVGPEAAKDHWVVTVPVVYTIGGPMPDDYGKWHAYVPGPARDVPWARDDTPGSADALAGGGMPFVRDSRFVLKTQSGADGDRS